MALWASVETWGWSHGQAKHRWCWPFDWQFWTPSGDGSNLGGPTWRPVVFARNPQTNFWSHLETWNWAFMVLLWSMVLGCDASQKKHFPKLLVTSSPYIPNIPIVSIGVHRCLHRSVAADVWSFFGQEPEKAKTLVEAGMFIQDNFLGKATGSELLTAPQWLKWLKHLEMPGFLHSNSWTRTSFLGNLLSHYQSPPSRGGCAVTSPGRMGMEGWALAEALAVSKINPGWKAIPSGYVKIAIENGNL